MVNEKRIKELFGEFSKDYDKHMEKTNHTNTQYKLLHNFIPAFKGRILDIATGTGTIADYVQRKTNLEVYAIDFSKEMLEKAKRKNSKIIFTNSNLESLPYPNNFFDIATCSFGFYWFRKPQKVIKEIKRILKLSGKFIVFEEKFNTENTSPKFSECKENYLKELAGMKNYLNVNLLKELLQKEKFKLKKEILEPIDDYHGINGMLFEKF